MSSISQFRTNTERERAKELGQVSRSRQSQSSNPPRRFPILVGTLQVISRPRRLLRLIPSAEIASRLAGAQCGGAVAADALSARWRRVDQDGACV